MIYLLDTNACVRYLRLPHGSAVSQKLASVEPADIALCSVVRTELVYGAHRSQNAGRNLAQVQEFCSRFVSLPLDDRSAEIAGHLRSQLATRGIPIGPYDLLIASIALANGLTLVTHNVAEFGRVPGLQIEDWEGAS